MFVKLGTSPQKLLDKKPLKIAAYGDSKGFKLLRILIYTVTEQLLCISICLLFLFENNLIGMDKPQLALRFLFYIFIGLHIIFVLFQLCLPLLLRFQLRLEFLFSRLVGLILVMQGYNLHRHYSQQHKRNQSNAQHR